MGFVNFLKKTRNTVLSQNPSALHLTNRFYSGTAYALVQKVKYYTQTYISGLVLDAGAGRGGWKELILQIAEKRESLDIKAYDQDGTDWIADLTNMPDVPSQRFDAIVCNQVLEHVKEPQAAINELYRVLKSDGNILISVPHLSRLHELPHDYFRFTPNGLEYLLESTGFNVIKVDTYGGVCTFLHHQFSTIFLGILSLSKPTYYAGVILNLPLSFISYLLDELLDRTNMMPNGVIIIASKT